MSELWIARLAMIAVTALLLVSAATVRRSEEAGCCFFAATIIGVTTFLLWNMP